jgi:hypothetical protein
VGARVAGSTVGLEPVSDGFPVNQVELVAARAQALKSRQNREARRTALLIFHRK